MSFAEANAALLNLFKVSAELPLAAAVDEMRSSMSIEATGSLGGLWFLRGPGVCGPDFLSEIGENSV